MIKGLKYYRPMDYAKRIAWRLVHPLFRWSPRLWPAWRNFLLRLFGARIGVGVEVHPTAEVTFPWNLSIGAGSLIGEKVKLYNLGALSIGERTVVSQHAHLCGGTHDFEAEDFPLLKCEIWIGDDAWIAADAFIGPGVRVERGAVVGARAVVVKNVPAQAIVAGNPARTIGTRQRERQY